MSRQNKVTMIVTMLAVYLCFELLILASERAVTWHIHAIWAIACATCTFLVWRL